MRRFASLVIGIGFGFGIAAFAIAAAVLFGVGVGGHYLASRDAGAAQVISFDPSNVAARAPFPAAISVLLLIGFVVVFLKIRRTEKQFERSSWQQQKRAGQLPSAFTDVQLRRD